MNAKKEFFEDFTVSVDDIIEVLSACELYYDVEFRVYGLLSNKPKGLSFYQSSHLGLSFIRELNEICDALFESVYSGQDADVAREIIKRYMDDNVNFLIHDKQTHTYLYNVKLISDEVQVLTLDKLPEAVAMLTKEVSELTKEVSELKRLLLKSLK